MDLGFSSGAFSLIPEVFLWGGGGWGRGRQAVVGLKYSL